MILGCIIILAIQRKQKEKRTSIDLKAKVKILRDVEQIEEMDFNGKNNGNISKKYKIKLSTLSGILIMLKKIYEGCRECH